MEIVENIVNNNYINHETKKNFIFKISKLSKKFRKIYYPKLKEYYISKYFDKNMVLLFGGIENMKNYPILRWNEKFMGGTDYIDNIKEKDLNSKIMIGIDNYKRPFITIRTKNNSKITVDTLFQRYSDEKNTWTNGCSDCSPLFKEGGYFYSKGKIMHKHIRINIKNLLQNKGYIFQQSFLSGEIKKINLLIE